MKLEKQSRLLFVGDSITDCDRARPLGDGAVGDVFLGNGYVSLVDAALTAAYPELAIRVMNTGVSGDTVRDLEARWERDVMTLKPDWLSVMIGINDVWRRFDGLWAPDFISLDEYTDALDRLITTVRPRLKGLVLMTPYYLDSDTADDMRRLMDQYGAAVAPLARHHDALFVDTQAAFDAVMAHVSPLQLAADRVHVGLAGHMVLAQAFLKGIEYEWGCEAATDVE